MRLQTRLRIISRIPPSRWPSTHISDLLQVRQGDIDAMSFKELDDFVDRGVQCIAFHHADVIKARKAMLPAIWRVHDALSCQGRRTDLLDAPADLPLTPGSGTRHVWARGRRSTGCSQTAISHSRSSCERHESQVEGKVDVGVVTRVHEVDAACLRWTCCSKVRRRLKPALRRVLSG